MRIRRHLFGLCATIAVCFSPLTDVAAQEKSWVGENVLPTKPAAEIGFSDWDGDKQVRFAFSGIWPIKVRDDRDGWLRIHDNRHEGWVARTDFVRVSEATEYFNRRIEANPNDFFAFYMRGSSRKEKGDNDGAIKDLTEAIRVNPKYAPSFNNRGMAHKAKKEYDEAIGDFGEAIRVKPNYALAYCNRGDTWRLKQELDRALQDLDEAVRLDPKFVRSYFNRGLVWKAKKDYDRAMQEFDAVIRLDAKYAVAYYGKAACLALQGRGDPALDNLRRALELGYRNVRLIAQDPDLASLHSDPRFQQLVAQPPK